MFERRLRILLALLGAVTAMLLLRACQVQVLSQEYWRQRAFETLKRRELVETTRGSIVDLRGREVAVDVACIDACVDYRAILREPAEKWVRTLARQRLAARTRSGAGGYRPGADKAERDRLLEQEVRAVRADIERMWAALAQESKQSPEAIDEIRRAVVQKVEMRRRYLWYDRYRAALQEHADREPAAWYKRWLLDEVEETPQLDSFAEEMGEQTAPHVILRAISVETANRLGKAIDRYPGLVLRPSMHRAYPYADVACHVLGHLSRVSREDLQNDPNIGGDELRKYYPNDLIGRTGLEALAEPALRGLRGRVETLDGGERVLATVPAVPGVNVQTTLDIDLQAEIQQMFKEARTVNPDGSLSEAHEMHGAAVVIDVPSGELRALASYPAYDLNKLDEQFVELRDDELDKPLLNRATQAQLVPGSTIKPVVGLGAITQGVIGVHEGIECTGYLVLRGRRFDVLRCWVASQYAHEYGDERIKHHPFPYPHQGSYGNPDGSLIFADALERSCNVYFETVADRLGLAGLAYWFDHMGLGRRTGLGIAESSGRIPERDDDLPSHVRLMNTWMSGIGQGPVAATPIQMANVAASIARSGVWMRPKLLRPGTPVDQSKLRNERGERIPDQVDLKLSPEALAAAKEGMVRVVNSRSGTGIYLNLDAHGRQVLPVTIAAKTGTAQAPRFWVPQRDADGRLVRDERGRVQRRYLTPATSRQPNTEVPWYRGTGENESKLDHAWIIGFAPADKPQIAFAVMVEYGGSGGKAAAPIAQSILEKCVEHGYLALAPRSVSVEP